MEHSTSFRPSASLPIAQQSGHPLRLQFSERKLLLVMGDLSILNGALLIMLLYRGDLAFSAPDLWTHLPWFMILSVIWLLVGFFLRIYELPRAASPVHSLWAAGGAVLVTAAIYLLVPYITPGLPQRRLELALFALLAVGGIALWRVAYATILAQPQFQQTALVIGAGENGRTLAHAVAELSGRAGNPIRGTGYILLGYVDDDPNKQGTRINGAPVLGDRHQLVDLVQRFQPDLLIVAITGAYRIHNALFRAILDCRAMGVSVTTMAALFERMTGRVPVEHVGQDLSIVMPISRSPTHRLYRSAKRGIDILASVAGLLAVALLIPPIWLANRMTAPGDLFFRQTRVGRHGETFQIIKFRSMIMDAEKLTGAVWASETDPRITPVGRFLRKTRIDELPQFWNVFRGEMSLIGPRPERPEFVDELSHTIPYYGVRHAVRPGISGWAQVKYRYGASAEDSLRKLEYDLYYIKHEGFFLDFVIALKTVQTMLGFKGR